MITFEIFKDRSQQIHNSSYSYEYVNYVNTTTKVKIICKKHGSFNQMPYKHMNGQGCPKCGLLKRTMDFDLFINKSNSIHNKYDYSLVKYINNSTKVDIICKEHGIFEQLPSDHLNGHGCPKCSRNQKLTNKEFIDKSNSIHNKYDYSLVKYINHSTKVNIICKEHGIFEQTPNNHLKGKGCPKCSKNKKLTKKEFIDKSNSIHGLLYDYSLVKYTNHSTKVNIICKEHGIFKQTPNSHLKGTGCPMCCKIRSNAELIIYNYLTYKNIDFVSQKRFEDCKNKNSLPFDFYLTEHNLCIEFDGEQHFKSIEYWGGDKSLETRQLNDKIKNNYCKENNIGLMRIRFDESISDKLNELISKIT